MDESEHKGPFTVSEAAFYEPNEPTDAVRDADGYAICYGYHDDDMQWIADRLNENVARKEEIQQLRSALGQARGYLHMLPDTRNAIDLRIEISRLLKGGK